MSVMDFTNLTNVDAILQRLSLQPAGTNIKICMFVRDWIQHIRGR